MAAVRLIIAIVLTVVLVPIGLVNGYYGVLGVYAGFEVHEAWSSAAVVYWMLLWIGVSYLTLVVCAWIWVFVRRNRVQLNSQPPVP